MYQVVHRLEDKLRILSEPFGGPEEVSKFMSKKDLDYLMLFPGRVWSIHANDYREETSRDSYIVVMTEMGYVPGSLYHVLDKHMNFLYSGRSDGTFGDIEEDRQLVLNCKHGDYYHVQFQNANGLVCLIIWIAVDLPPAYRSWYLETYRKIEKEQRFRIVENELFFEFEGTIRLYMYEAPRSANPSIDTIKRLAYRGDQTNTSYIKPRVSSWFIFEREGSLVPVKEVTGVGHQRWIKIDNRYYLELQRIYDTLLITNVDETVESTRKVHLNIKLA